jgi:hypothetical protein
LSVVVTFTGSLLVHARPSRSSAWERVACEVRDETDSEAVDKTFQIAFSKSFAGPGSSPRLRRRAVPPEVAYRNDGKGADGRLRAAATTGAPAPRRLALWRVVVAGGCRWHRHSLEAMVLECREPSRCGAGAPLFKGQQYPASPWVRFQAPTPRTAS